MTADGGAVDVLVFGSIWYVGHQLTDQRVARALRDAGNNVVYVDPAMNVLVGARHQTQGQHQRLGRTLCDDGTEVLTPAILPLGRRPALAVMTTALIALQVLFAVRRRMTPDTVVLLFAAHPTLLLFLRRWRSIAVVKDDYAAGAQLVGRRSTLIERRRRVMLSRATRIATVSSVLRGTLLRQGFVATVIGAGVDISDAAHPEPPDLSAVPHPRALFSGMVSDRIDLDLLAAVVDAGWQLVLVGGQQPTFSQAEQLAALLARDGVHALGWRDSSEVQAVAQWCDVGLVPYVLSAFNIASSPLKTLEYLAAGLPVLSTPLPAVLEFDSPDIEVVTRPADLADRLAECAVASGDDTARQRRTAFARANSWSHRAAEYVTLARNG